MRASRSPAPPPPRPPARRTAGLVHAFNELVDGLDVSLVLGVVALDPRYRRVQLEGQQHLVGGLVWGVREVWKRSSLLESCGVQLRGGSHVLLSQDCAGQEGSTRQGSRFEGSCAYGVDKAY
jgi:hypothetical protein